MTLVIIPLYGSAWATTDLTTLGSPVVTISPATGPPGTEITIIVSHLPDISGEVYPYPDLYIYLPFSQPFGVTVPSHCGGEDCFPIYTHDDALKKNFADRTVSFSLFSTNNPKPIFLNGYENSNCDVVVNGKIVERFSTLCNTKDEPVGTYQIKLVWILETNLEQRATTKTVQFAVTPGSSTSSAQVVENGNSVIKEYQNGKINGSEFLSKLRALGWNDEQIRQALAVIGKLPHQMSGGGPDNTQDVIQDMSISKQNKTERTSSPIPENNTLQSPKPTTVLTPPKVNYTEQNNSSMPQQNNSSAIPQQNTLPSMPQQNNSSWNNIIIGSSIAVVAVVVSVVVVLRKVKGTR